METDMGKFVVEELMEGEKPGAAAGTFAILMGGFATEKLPAGASSHTVPRNVESPPPACG
jgi:hypothetical protein